MNKQKLIKIFQGVIDNLKSDSRNEITELEIKKDNKKVDIKYKWKS